jgi:hypothetical protein
MRWKDIYYVYAILQLQLLEKAHQFSTFFNNESTTTNIQEENKSIKMCSKLDR